MSPAVDSTMPQPRWVSRLSWALVAVTVLGQILWILVSGSNRTALTVATVLAFAALSALQVWAAGGLRVAALYLVVTVGVGWAAEAVGTRFGLPFGEYEYTDRLGWQLAEVPLLIPLAWSMMALPMWLLVRTLRFRAAPDWVLAALCFASWDLFLDPQMVGEGYWVWRTVEPALPGIPGIPLINFMGWVLVALLLMRLVSLLPLGSRLPAPLAALLSWVYFSNVFAALVFFDRPGVAAWGAAAMGCFVLPWWWRLWQGRR